MNKTYITASEIGEFTYCKRAWWLRKQGLLETTSAMEEGSRQHSKLSSLLWRHKILLALGLLLLGVGILGIILYFVITNF